MLYTVRVQRAIESNKMKILTKYKKSKDKERNLFIHNILCKMLLKETIINY